MKEKYIVSYTSEQLHQMEDLSNWEYLNSLTDEEIEQNALNDPDNLPVSEDMLPGFRPVNPQEQQLRRQQQLSNHPLD
ncbi:MAG: hypothetical protein HC890_10960 [Chloroflexaceae bacterium]|nr:hypothetical protein [Chloroflexaceae bacterium]